MTLPELAYLTVGAVVAVLPTVDPRLCAELRQQRARVPVRWTYDAGVYVTALGIMALWLPMLVVMLAILPFMRKP